MKENSEDVRVTRWYERMKTTSSFFLTSFFFLLFDFSSPSHSSPEPELELLLEEDDLDLKV